MFSPHVTLPCPGCIDSSIDARGAKRVALPMTSCNWTATRKEITEALARVLFEDPKYESTQIPLSDESQ